MTTETEPPERLVTKFDPLMMELRTRLIKMAAAMLHGHEFLSQCFEDHPKRMSQRQLAIQGEKQRERLRLWAIECREVADCLPVRVDHAPHSERSPLHSEVERLREALWCWVDHEGTSCFLLGADGWCGQCARCVTRKALDLPLTAEAIFAPAEEEEAAARAALSTEEVK